MFTEQGRDKDCILVSFVRSSEQSTRFGTSLLGDWHRINVAITRPKVNALNFLAHILLSFFFFYPLFLFFFGGSEISVIFSITIKNSLIRKTTQMDF